MLSREDGFMVGFDSGNDGLKSSTKGMLWRESLSTLFSFERCYAKDENVSRNE